MAATNYRDQFPKANEAETQTPNPDYWGQFPGAEEPGLGEPSSPNGDTVEPQEQQQTPEMYPSFLDRAKRIAGVAAHGFSQGVGGLADIAATAEERNTPEGFPLNPNSGLGTSVYKV